MANCAGITKGATISCESPLLVGIKQRVLLANLEDIEDVTRVGSDNRIITGITMKSGKAFYDFAGINNTIQARYELVRNPASNTYKHFVDLSVFEVDSTQLKNTEGMAFQNQVGIIIQADDSSLGNGAINVFGINSGMQLLTDTRDWGDVETGGAMVLNLGTPDDGAVETQKPNPFFDTDYDASLAKVEALLTPAP